VLQFLMPSTSYNFLDMLREASTDAADKTFKLQFEVVYGGQSSFAGISFDRYLPTTVVVVSVLVAFNFFRSALLACRGDVHPFCCHLRVSSTSSQTICSKVSAYFRGSNPHQADFMQQGVSLCPAPRSASHNFAIRQGPP
jgi:hypothetical protein